MFFKEKYAELKAAVRMPVFPEFLCDAGVQQVRDRSQEIMPCFCA